MQWKRHLWLENHEYILLRPVLSTIIAENSKSLVVVRIQETENVKITQFEKQSKPRMKTVTYEDFTPPFPNFELG